MITSEHISVKEKLYLKHNSHLKEYWTVYTEPMSFIFYYVLPLICSEATHKSGYSDLSRSYENC